MIYLLCNAPIQKLKQIFISSLWHLTEIYTIFRNSTNRSFPTLLCDLQAARFWLYVFAINSKMVKIYLTDTHYLYYCLMDMKIDRLVGFVIQNIQKILIFKKLKMKKKSKFKK